MSKAKKTKKKQPRKPVTVAAYRRSINKHIKRIDKTVAEIAYWLQRVDSKTQTNWHALGTHLNGDRHVQCKCLCKKEKS